MKLLKIAALLAATAMPAFAHDYHVGDLAVVHPFGFAVHEGARASGGFLEITNEGTEADRLVAVEAAFSMVQIHDNIINAEGIASMVHLEDGVVIPAGETVTLAPGGKHIMFMGDTDLERVEGSVVPAVLVFENAGRLEVEFQIKSRMEGGMDHSAMQNGQMDHSTMTHDTMTMTDGKMDHSTMGTATTTQDK